ncbi:MAG: nucleotidyltransferase domain-containing protein [Treponema sp.]|jgi:predicted nucleotidyltransferase|nr:nucleotidyltransferase domain-containing protein [Treponema sp.]
MRISEHEKTVIIEAVKDVDPAAQVWLFGSRTSDAKKGGDIDIAILSKPIRQAPMNENKIRRFICNKIGEQKIDIISSEDGGDPFFRLAVSEGIKLS